MSYGIFGVEKCLFLLNYISEVSGLFFPNLHSYCKNFEALNERKDQEWRFTCLLADFKNHFGQISEFSLPSPGLYWLCFSSASVNNSAVELAASLGISRWRSPVWRCVK